MKQSIFFFVVAMACISCNYNKQSAARAESHHTKNGSITEKPFGLVNGEAVVEYTLSNPSGMQAGIINYGGTVTQLITPDKTGKMGDVVLGYDSLSGFLQKANPYFGALIGRYGNRIAAGKFNLDGTTYTLAGNDHGNSLHGGIKGFDKVVWKAEKLPGDSSLKLTYRSRDGEEGYPGNLNVAVVYTLTSDNALKLEYSATTDKPTPVNLTNHCYFNLSAGKEATILNHVLQIDADKFTPVNDQLIPTGKLESVQGTPMDFRSAKTVGKDISGVKGGYDHNWVLNKKGNDLSEVANLYEPNSGRYMQVFTTEPGLQFYSGNFLDGSLSHTKDGQKYVQHAALCLETQHFPDSPNQPAFPNTILKPGETYKHTTLYKFSVK